MSRSYKEFSIILNFLLACCEGSSFCFLLLALHGLIIYNGRGMSKKYKEFSIILNFLLAYCEDSNFYFRH